VASPSLVRKTPMSTRSIGTPALPDLGVVASHDDVERVNAQPYERYVPFGSTYQALASAAEHFRTRPAITYWSSPGPADHCRRWTPGMLWAHIQRSARLFGALAGGGPPRVAMLLPAIPEAYLTLWGAEAVGVACPMN